MMQWAEQPLTGGVGRRGRLARASSNSVQGDWPGRSPETVRNSQFCCRPLPGRAAGNRTRAHGLPEPQFLSSSIEPSEALPFRPCLCTQRPHLLGVGPVLPGRPPAPFTALRRSWSRALAAVQPTAAVLHGGSAPRHDDTPGGLASGTRHPAMQWAANVAG